MSILQFRRPRDPQSDLSLDMRHQLLDTLATMGPVDRLAFLTGTAQVMVDAGATEPDAVRAVLQLYEAASIQDRYR